jgi:hypothetical protein
MWKKVNDDKKNEDQVKPKHSSRDRWLCSNTRHGNALIFEFLMVVHVLSEEAKFDNRFTLIVFV